MGYRSTDFRKAMFLAVAAITATGTAGHVLAQDSGIRNVRNYYIEEQQLGDALRRFAVVSGRDLLFTPDLVDGKTAPTVNGSFAEEQVLEMLLSYTDLEFYQTSSGALALRRRALMTRVANAAIAQSTSPPVRVAQAPSQNETLDEVMVTGSRIVRDGYEAPTPVSVLGAEQLNAMAVTNIADAVNRLPALAGSVTSRNSSTSVGSGTAGINQLNLRGLAPTRTLVLLDGKRVVGATLAGFDNNGGAVDVNSFPNALISRVDVVTGGASAIYGSDALSGVVNFVLDKQYTGVKASVEGGITSKRDDEQYKVSLTAGTPFAGGRGHFLISGEHTYEDGILEGKTLGNPRSWVKPGYQLVNNPGYLPTNGQPQLITVFNAAPNNATRGGLIVSCPIVSGGTATTACPLRGTQFLEGGSPAAFNFGTLAGGLMIGGDWQLSRIDQDPMLAMELSREAGFSRVSFNVSDNTAIFAELQAAHSRGINLSGVPNFNFGNVTVLSGNPFIPASVQAQMTANGIPSFMLGTYNSDMPQLGANNGRTLTRYAVGAEGNFDLSTTWNWDVYYSNSRMDIVAEAPGNRINANYTRAIDSVLDPSSGRIACRVNVDANPANDDPSCVSYNPMGINVNSAAAINYVTGSGYINTILDQEVVAASARGEPFSTWVDAVSVAFGAEHRRESVSGRASALDEANAFFAGNFHASRGHYDVTEGFVETVVPLAKDLPLMRALDFNGAVRYTDYSTSGGVVTWKAGLTFRPIDDVMLRVTRSRDIRAPNLGDLYNAGRSGTGNISDPITNTTRVIVSAVGGNPSLDPEEADTTGLGIVFTPSFLPGFAASVDYYDIQIKDAIASLGPQQYVDRCYTSQPQLCPFITRDSSGFISSIRVQPANILAQNAKGFDVEMSYGLPLTKVISSWAGELRLRAMATFVDTLETVDTLSVIDGAGVVAGDFGIGAGNALKSPDLRFLLMAAYTVGPANITASARGTGSGVYNNSFIECVSSCPTATVEHPTINNNRVDSVAYYDLAFNYKAFEQRAEFFVVAENVLDEDPALIAGSRSNGYYNGQGNGDYDRLGRIFRAGVRVSF